MIIEIDDIAGIVALSQGDSSLEDLFSPQEFERFCQILYGCLSELEAQGYVLSENFEKWKTLAKAKINKELGDVAANFGINNFESIFDAESFLQTFYNFESGNFTPNISA